jgi:hypothetical protein
MSMISGLWGGPGYTMAVSEGGKVNGVYWRGTVWGGISKRRGCV